tara:strand:- start:477 stop:800 length:324 start_codon:yes stop_codon:yes gene_type:complete
MDTELDIRIKNKKIHNSWVDVDLDYEWEPSEYLKEYLRLNPNAAMNDINEIEINPIQYRYIEDETHGNYDASSIIIFKSDEVFLKEQIIKNYNDSWSPLYEDESYAY